jgi:hypothetical protein
MGCPAPGTTLTPVPGTGIAGGCGCPAITGTMPTMGNVGGITLPGIGTVPVPGAPGVPVAGVPVGQRAVQSARVEKIGTRGVH